jgi:CRP-like cAMP-binding protein
MRKRVPRSVLAGLRHVPLFSKCTNRQLRKVAALGTQVPIEAGRELTVTGTPGAEWFVVLSGRASCRVRGYEVASFGPGDFFVELSLIDGSARSATVVAETPLALLDLDRAEFSQLLEVAPSVVRRCSPPWRLGREPLTQRSPRLPEQERR